MNLKIMRNIPLGEFPFSEYSSSFNCLNQNDNDCNYQQKVYYVSSLKAYKANEPGDYQYYCNEIE